MLVMCSDVNIYVCKYMRSSATAYKLACELIGAKLAKAWRLTTPDIALVNIRPLHWEGINVSHSLSAPSIGFRWLDGVVDITPSTHAKVPAKAETLAGDLAADMVSTVEYDGDYVCNWGVKCIEAEEQKEE